MRVPSPIVCEGLCYVFIACLALIVIAHASKTPTDPISPDESFMQASR